MKLYDIIPENDRKIIDEVCPFKIGDNISITKVVGTSVDTFNAKIIDISVDLRDKDDIFKYIPHEYHDFISVNTEELNKYNPRFVLHCEYYVSKFKLFRKRETYREVCNVYINRYGQYDGDLKGIIDYIITKTL